MISKWIKTAQTLLLIGLASAPALAVGSAEQLCVAAKEKAAGKSLDCRTTAYGKAADQTGLDQALAKCNEKITGMFAKADAKYPADCPTSEDGADVDAFAAAVVRQLGAYLSGATAALSCQPQPVAAVFAPEGVGRKCIAGKTKAAAKDAACRMNAHAKFAKSGASVARDAALAKCAGALSKAFGKLEEKYAGACVTSDDTALIDGVVVFVTDALATYLPGSSPLPVCAVYTATATPSHTSTRTPTNTPTITPTTMPTVTPTDTPTATPSDTPPATPTDTPSDTPTDTPTPAPTATPTPGCGDGVVMAGEECDGTNLNGGGKCRDLLGLSWTDYASCNSSCQYDTSSCRGVVAASVEITHTQSTVSNPSVLHTTLVTDPELIRLGLFNSLTATVTNPLDAGFYPGDPPFLFHWVMKSSSKPDGYSDAGMTGYHSATLTIGLNSLISGETQTWTEFTVTSPSTALFSLSTVNLDVRQSTLSLELFDLCQTKTMVGTNEGDCTIAAALPATEPT